MARKWSLTATFIKAYGKEIYVTKLKAIGFRNKSMKERQNHRAWLQAMPGNKYYV